MNSTPKYCGHCGARLGAGLRFCTQCGQPVTQSPASPSTPVPPVAPAAQAPLRSPVRTAPSAPVSEPIVGIIPGLSRSKGFLGMGSESYSLIVTPARLVFASISKKAMQQAIQTARQEAKGQGKGFFGQWGAQLAWLDVISRRYQSMPVDATIAENPGSFFVPNHQVSKVRFRQHRQSEETAFVYEMFVHTDGGKYKFQLRGASIKDARRTLQQTLGSAVH